MFQNVGMTKKQYFRALKLVSRLLEHITATGQVIAHEDQEPCVLHGQECG